MAPNPRSGGSSGSSSGGSTGGSSSNNNSRSTNPNSNLNTSSRSPGSNTPAGGRTNPNPNNPNGGGAGRVGTTLRRVAPVVMTARRNIPTTTMRRVLVPTATGKTPTTTKKPGKVKPEIPGSEEDGEDEDAEAAETSTSVIPTTTSTSSILTPSPTALLSSPSPSSSSSSSSSPPAVGLYIAIGTVIGSIFLAIIAFGVYKHFSKKRRGMERLPQDAEGDEFLAGSRRSGGAGGQVMVEFDGGSAPMVVSPNTSASRAGAVTSGAAAFGVGAASSLPNRPESRSDAVSRVSAITTMPDTSYAPSTYSFLPPPPPPPSLPPAAASYTAYQPPSIPYAPPSTVSGPSTFSTSEPPPLPIPPIPFLTLEIPKTEPIDTSSRGSIYGPLKYEDYSIYEQPGVGVENGISANIGGSSSQVQAGGDMGERSALLEGSRGVGGADRV